MAVTFFDELEKDIGLLGFYVQISAHKSDSSDTIMLESTMYIKYIVPLICALAFGAGFQNAALGGMDDSYLLKEGPLSTFEEALQKHGVKLTVPELVQALKSTDPEVRWLAAVKLGQDNVGEAVPAIRDALRSEPDPITRVNVASSLARFGEAEGFDSLIDVCLNPGMPPYVKALSTMHMLDLKREDQSCRDALIEANPCKSCFP